MNLIYTFFRVFFLKSTVCDPLNTIASTRARRHRKKVPFSSHKVRGNASPTRCEQRDPKNSTYEKNTRQKGYTLRGRHCYNV